MIRVNKQMKDHLLLQVPCWEWGLRPERSLLGLVGPMWGKEAQQYGRAEPPLQGEGTRAVRVLNGGVPRGALPLTHPPPNQQSICRSSSDWAVARRIIGRALTPSLLLLQKSTGRERGMGIWRNVGLSAPALSTPPKYRDLPSYLKACCWILMVTSWRSIENISSALLLSPKMEKPSLHMSSWLYSLKDFSDL